MPEKLPVTPAVQARESFTQEIINLNIDELDAEALEQRIELAAAHIDFLGDMADCNNYGDCSTYTGTCNNFGTCGTHSAI